MHISDCSIVSATRQAASHTGSDVWCFLLSRSPDQFRQSAHLKILQNSNRGAQARASEKSSRADVHHRKHLSASGDFQAEGRILMFRE